MDDKQFGQLLEFLALSWTGYRRVRKGVKKRVRRHMRDLGCRDIGEYIESLEQNEHLKEKCERLMSVSISRFFRDHRLWELLRQQILPEIISTGKARIRVWSAGCACGEEVYSLKIIWELLHRSSGNLPELEITATDLNPANLQRAQNGIYPPSSVREVPQDLRISFFQTRRGGKRFIISPALKSGIRWMERNIFGPPPGTGYQLIFVRNNLLTYFQPERIEPAMTTMINSLSIGGFLVTGSKEKHRLEHSNLKQCESLPYIFQKSD